MEHVSDVSRRELIKALESLLFVATEPVDSNSIASVFGISRQEAESLLAELSSDLSDSNRGVHLRRIAGGWRMYTHPDCDEYVRKFVQSWDMKKLSTAALETLAVIVYTQPATREGVKAVRGVSSDSAISSLIDRGLVREVGRREGGGAVTYGTTKTFLERFGLSDLSQLPSLEEFAPDEQTRRLIQERLGATLNDIVKVESEG